MQCHDIHLLADRYYRLGTTDNPSQHKRAIILSTHHLSAAQYHRKGCVPSACNLGSSPKRQTVGAGGTGPRTSRASRAALCSEPFLVLQFELVNVLPSNVTLQPNMPCTLKVSYTGWLIPRFWQCSWSWFLYDTTNGCAAWTRSTATDPSPLAAPLAASPPPVDRRWHFWDPTTNTFIWKMYEDRPFPSLPPSLSYSLPPCLLVDCSHFTFLLFRYFLLSHIHLSCQPAVRPSTFISIFMPFNPSPFLSTFPFSPKTTALSCSGHLLQLLTWGDARGRCLHIGLYDRPWARLRTRCLVQVAEYKLGRILFCQLLAGLWACTVEHFVVVHQRGHETSAWIPHSLILRCGKVELLAKLIQSALVGHPSGGRFHFGNLSFWGGCCAGPRVGSLYTCN